MHDRYDTSSDSSSMRNSRDSNVRNSRDSSGPKRAVRDVEDGIVTVPVDDYLETEEMGSGERHGRSRGNETKSQNNGAFSPKKERSRKGNGRRDNDDSRNSNDSNRNR